MQLFFSLAKCGESAKRFYTNKRLPASVASSLVFLGYLAPAVGQLVINGIYLRFICARRLATRASFFHLFFSAIADLISCLRARYVNSFCNFS